MAGVPPAAEVGRHFPIFVKRRIQRAIYVIARQREDDVDFWFGITVPCQDDPAVWLHRYCFAGVIAIAEVSGYDSVLVEGRVR
jgi:hypothetical protein